MINETDGAGMTALHISSMSGYTKVVQLLLHKGALLHKDFVGRTPLHLAAKGGHTQTIRLLLAFHGNLLNQRDRENVRSSSILPQFSPFSPPFRTRRCITPLSLTSPTPARCCFRSTATMTTMTTIARRSTSRSKAVTPTWPRACYSTIGGRSCSVDPHVSTRVLSSG